MDNLTIPVTPPTPEQEGRKLTEVDMYHNVPKTRQEPVLDPATGQQMVDETGKPVFKTITESGKERTKFVAMLPYVSDAEVLAMLKGEHSAKMFEFITMLINDEIKSVAQYAINKVKASGGELTQAIFNIAEMELSYLINKPKPVSAELWKEFAVSYIQVMTKAPINHSLQGATNASKALASDKLDSFSGASDETLDKFGAIINTYFSNCGTELATKYAGIYKYLTDTIESFKAKDFGDEFS